MDRLPTLTAGLSFAMLIAASACDDEGTQPAPSRVVAVPAAEEPTEDPCDLRPQGGATLSLPELAQGEELPVGRIWLNVWATWCRPCVEELPRLRGWDARLRSEGVPTRFVYLSADADADAITRFQESHPAAPSDRRVADPEGIPTWLEGLGLDPGGTLPIHILTGDGGRIRCVRSGAVGDSHYDAFRDVLAGGG